MGRNGICRLPMTELAMPKPRMAPRDLENGYLKRLPDRQVRNAKSRRLTAGEFCGLAAASAEGHPFNTSATEKLHLDNSLRRQLCATYCVFTLS